MADNAEAGKRLEQLLESLIKMVGKTNEHVNSLNKRVSEIEWLIQNNELHPAEQDSKKRYCTTQGRCSQNPSQASPFTISV